MHDTAHLGERLMKEAQNAMDEISHSQHSDTCDPRPIEMFSNTCSEYIPHFFESDAQNSYAWFIYHVLTRCDYDLTTVDKRHAFESEIDNLTHVSRNDAQ